MASFWVCEKIKGRFWTAPDNREFMDVLDKYICIVLNTNGKSANQYSFTPYLYSLQQKYNIAVVVEVLVMIIKS